MRKCPYCAEDIQSEAIKCKHCGSVLSHGVTPSGPPAGFPPEVTGVSAPDPAHMVSAPGTGASPGGDVRRGVTQAKFNEENGGLLMLEIAGISIAAGSMTDSWLIGGGIFLTLMIVLHAAPKIFMFFAFVMSVGWGYLGWHIGSAWIGNTGAAVVISVLAFLVTMGAHLAGIQHLKDI